ncbi:MAG: phytoene desaturase family protein [Solirubrobacteraceae bacterium]
MGPTGQRGVHDAVVVGGGHNGLVAATLLARGGRSVLVLERRQEAGGAAVNSPAFPGVAARLSRYAYLVSLLPATLIRTLGLRVELRPRAAASYSPCGDTGLLVTRHDEETRESMTRLTGDQRAHEAWQGFRSLLERVAERLFPTLTEPLRSREEMRRLLDDEEAWRALFEEPLSAVLERTFASDLVRGLVCTDAMIGTFAAAADPLLRQNRCFLYHVIGNGTGRWDIPVGGMGALSDALATAARRAGAHIHTGAEVVELATDGRLAEVTCADGQRFRARHVLANVAPTVLGSLLDEKPSSERPEGSALKVNMVLSRLPRLRDPLVSPELAFAGTFHVNEGYGQLQRAYEEASALRIPTEAPCELYCHSLSDPSVLSAPLRAAGAHTLTIFGLHMPARLFRDNPDQAKREAVAATIRAVNSALAEPLEECLWRDADGRPCLEALTPPDLEAELGLPGGHIFHRDLTWPYAEREDEVGGWGVETAHDNVWICGAGARRGGGVSGIPGHNAARAVLEA